MKFSERGENLYYMFLMTSRRIGGKLKRNFVFARIWKLPTDFALYFQQIAVKILPENLTVYAKFQLQKTVIKTNASADKKELSLPSIQSNCNAKLTQPLI